MQLFDKKEKRNKIKIFNIEEVYRVHSSENEISKLELYNGQFKPSACLSCVNPVCMQMSKDEITCSKLATFSGDSNLRVCPVDAISWDYNKEIPCINSDKCIMCGLCACRCPMGAIYFKDDMLYINEKSDMVIELEFDKTNTNEQINIIEIMLGRGKVGTIRKENDMMIEALYEKIYSNIARNSLNTFVRNLMITGGYFSSSRRAGENYFRMDSIFQSNKEFGTIEIEPSADTLSASRRILEDLAVLNSRHAIMVNENIPLVVCFSLPNVRQGYWQVIKDINRVENIRINTISIGAMLIVLWNNKSLIGKVDNFYADFDNMSIRNIVKKIIEREINITNKHLGVFEPTK